MHAQRERGRTVSPGRDTKGEKNCLFVVVFLDTFIWKNYCVVVMYCVVLWVKCVSA